MSDPLAETIDFERDDFFYEEETAEQARARMNAEEADADRLCQEPRWLLSFQVTPRGQSHAFPIAVEFSVLAQAEAHRRSLEQEPECSHIALTVLTGKAPPRCGRCGEDLRAGERIVCDFCHQKDRREQNS